MKFRLGFTALAIATLAGISAASAIGFRTLHVFTDKQGGFTSAALALGPNGNLYGVTEATVFSVAPKGKFQLIHRFGNLDGVDGEWSGVVFDSAGNMFGTTQSAHGFGSGVYGTVFEIDSTGQETILHQFTPAPNGSVPLQGLTFDSLGNLYGTTSKGGLACHCGTVFRITTAGDFTLLHSFAPTEGALPWGGRLIIDHEGNLFGVTNQQGPNNCATGIGCGTIYKLDTSGLLTVLYAFQGGNDGSQPQGSLLADGSGNLYGTTFYGGGGSACSFGCGTIYKLAPDGTETVLYAFQDGSDGAFPEAGLVRDSAGNFYGVAFEGGDKLCRSGGNGCGTVFELTANGQFSVLHTFKATDGANPAGELLLSKRTLFGTTATGGGTGCGGNGCGTVFRVVL
ncbi:MAG: hypothetical protein JO261_04745 [Alphaproteobacteria bacterium]|nr:hypothetical protein [Alphaproteobacteria bacterium]MBV9692989.1 hypothetical protein [Alphaproteobacteria bacterium]